MKEVILIDFLVNCFKALGSSFTFDIAGNNTELIDVSILLINKVGN